MNLFEYELVADRHNPLLIDDEMLLHGKQFHEGDNITRGRSGVEPAGEDFPTGFE
jgi:hypothetical protein